MGRIKVAVIGVGNLCSALVQGIEYCGKIGGEEVRYREIGGYKVSDIEIVSAVDVDSRKVGRDLSQAIFSDPNKLPMVVEVPEMGVKVVRGPILDGVTELTRKFIRVGGEAEDISSEFKRRNVDVVVNMVPSGAVKASEWYAGKAIEAGCAFVNATPAPIAVNESLVEKFREKGLPVVGDDLMDQIGSTMIHKGLIKTILTRNAKIEKSYSLDVGGGTENLNALDSRVKSMKRRLKSESIEALIPYKVPIVAGTTDFVDFLGNKRVSYIRIEGKQFMGFPYTIDMWMDTYDAPNGAYILIDVIRAVKMALDKGMAGFLEPVSAYGFKVPVSRLTADELVDLFEEFVGVK